jgi:hypothetical protein
MFDAIPDGAKIERVPSYPWHDMPTAENIFDVATWILGRPLTEQDGVPAAECAAAEQRLGCAVPAALSDFYLAMGRQPAITSSFERFFEPDQWTISDKKVVFLEENQGVCCWAADSEAKVYQAADPNASEWHEEPVDLPEFLRVVLYYQMAQGGYPFCGMISSDQFSGLDGVHALINDMGGRQVVDMGGLRIFVVADQVLVWYLHKDKALESGLFLSALREEPFERLCGQWLFADLN